MTNFRILIIDDDINVLELAKYHLQERGFEVDTAQSAEEGLHAHTERPADLIVTDLRLPDLNGLQLLKRVKDLSPETEFIMITGFGSVPQAVEAMKAGAFYFVEKPLMFDELATLIENALERRRKMEQNSHSQHQPASLGGHDLMPASTLPLERGKMDGRATLTGNHFDTVMAGPMSFEDLCKCMVETLEAPKGENGGRNIFERLEGEMVRFALKRTHGNKQAAANLLGLYRPRLYSIIKKHNLMNANGDK